MSNDYTLIADLNNAGMHQRMSPQQMGMPPQHMGMPPQMSPSNNIDMYQKYLNESESDSDSGSESDSENDSGRSKDSGDNWQHYYGLATLILLVIILFYVYKIRKELMGMYEEI